MLQVATQKMDAVKTDFSSKSKTQGTDCNEKFEDYLSSITADSDGANATISGKGVKNKKSCSTDDSENDKSNEKESLESGGSTVAPVPNTSQCEETKQIENTASSQPETLENDEDQKKYMSQMMPIMPMTSTMVQQYVDEMGSIDTGSSLDAKQIASLTDSIGSVSASSSLDLQQAISINSSIDNVGGFSLSDSQQATPIADITGSFSTNSSADVLNVNVNSVQDSIERMSFVSLDVNQAEVSALPIEVMKDDFITEDFISTQQIGETPLNPQRKVYDPVTSSIVVQVDTSKNQLQTGEVAPQNVVDSTNSNTIFTNNNETMKQSVVSQNVQMSTDTVNDSLKMGQAQITVGTGNEMSKTAQTPITAEKTVINESEPKVKAVISKGSANEIDTGVTSDNTEQATSAESQFIATARVFSGKENDITAAVNQENIVNQVTNSIVTMVKSDNQKFTIELTPEALGKITVEMKYVSGKLEMKISADNTVTAKVLGEKIAELKSSLTSNNVDVLNIDISDSSVTHSSFTDLSKNSNQAGGQSNDTNKRQSRDNENLYNDASVSDDNANAATYYTQNRLLNYLV